MAEDILLTVGISLESIKKATTQIERELRTLKAPTALDISSTAKKQLNDTEKFIHAAKNELGKLGSAIGKDKLSDYLHIEPETAKNASEAVRDIESAVDSNDIALRKLSITTDFYSKKNAIMQTSLASVKAELSAYLKAEAQGVVLDDAAIQRKQKLTEAYARLEKQQKGFFHGIDLGRLLLWAVGWKILYGGINAILNSLSQLVTTIKKVNEVVLVSRAANQELARSFDQTYASIRNSIYSAAQESTISVQQLANAYKTLVFEGQKAVDAAKTLQYVRTLMTVTGEREDIVAQALIETYGMFKDKIKGAQTESEKFARITDLLTALYTKAHISIKDYQQIMGFIAPTAGEAVESFDSLVRLLMMADSQMLGGRRAGTALIEVLQRLTENSQQLTEVFGITFNPDEPITFNKVLEKIRISMAGLSNKEQREKLQLIFKGAALEIVSKYVKESADALSSVTSDIDGLGRSTEEAFNKAHWLGIGTKDLWQTITKIVHNLGSFYNKNIYEPLGDFLGMVKKIPSQSKVMQYDPKTNQWKEITKEQHSLLTDSKKLNESIVASSLNAKKFKDVEASITPELRKQLTIVEQTVRLRLLESQNARPEIIAQRKAKDAIIATAQLIGDQAKKEQFINDLYVAREESAEKIVALMRSYGLSRQDDKNAVELATKLADIKADKTLALQEESKVFANITLQKRMQNTALREASGGVPFAAMIEEKRAMALEKVGTSIASMQQREIAINALYSAREKTEQEIYKIARNHGVSEQAATEYVNALLEIRTEMNKEMIEEQKTLINIALQRRTQMLSIYETGGASLMFKIEEKRAIALEKATSAIIDREQRENAINKLYEARNESEEKILTIARDLGITEQEATEYVNSLIEARFEIYKEMISEINSLANEFESATADYLKDIFHGKLNPQEYLTSIMDSYKSALAEQLTTIFGERTGIFTNMASAFMSPLQKAHYTGVKDAAPLIIKAHMDGIMKGTQQANMMNAQLGEQGTEATRSSNNFLKSIVDTVLNQSGMKSGQTQTTSSNQYATIKQSDGSIVSVPVKSGGSTGGGTTGTTTAGGGSSSGLNLNAQSGLAMLAFVNDMSQAYKAKGSGNPWGSAMNLGISGGIAGFTVGGPVGAVIGAAVGATYGFIRGAQSKTETDEAKRQTVEITSKINVTNKELQIVNRNLEGIRKGFEGFIHPRSAYFSERLGVEERFDIDRTRGYYG